MKKSLLPLLIACAVAQPAVAAFYVDDDTPKAVALAAPTQLPPASYDRAKSAPVEQPKESTTVEIPFFSTAGTVGPKGRSLLQSVLPDMQVADEIRVIAFGTKSANTALQKQRTQSLQAWMVANGIAASKIVLMESSDSGKPHFVNVTMSTTAKQPRNAVVPQTASRFANARLMTSATEAPQASGPSPVYLSTTAAPSITPPSEQAKPLFNDQVKLDLVQRIVRMSQNKIVKPEDAINMLADILKGQEPAAPAALPAQGQINHIVTVEMPRSWTLDSSKTLQENITEWALAAKWETPKWIPTAPYRVAYNSTLNGTFVDVLRQVSDVVPSLDFEANKGKRTLTVTESRIK